LEKAKSEKEAHGKFESECPGYCGAQDNFYIGNMKGAGRIYQQTFATPLRKWRLRNRSLSLGAAKPRPEGSQDADHRGRSPE